MRLLLPLLAAITLLLAACETMPQGMRERFATVPPKIATYEADARTVYFAAQQAFKRLDYHLVRTSLNGYRIEAASRINTSAVFKDSRQLVAHVAIAETGPRQAELSLRLVEQFEGRGLGGASELALKDHGFYETYLSVVQSVLNEQTAPEAPKNN